MGFSLPWTEEEINTLVRCFKEGMNNAEIAQEVGRPENGVKNILRTRRKQLGLPKRPKTSYSRKRKSEDIPPSAFDIAYHGPVPCGHWLVTKPWGIRK